MTSQSDKLTEAKQLVYEYFWRLCGDALLCSRMSDIVAIRNFQKNECILEAGERTTHIYLVLKGLVRGFYIDASGSEITKCFARENEWCCSYSYMTDEPSPFFVETLEDTMLAGFSHVRSREILDSSSRLRTAMEKLLSGALLQVEKRSMSFAAMEAKDRYRCFLTENPDLAKRVKQEYIASYLGITPSSLSRIKRTLILPNGNDK